MRTTKKNLKITLDQIKDNAAKEAAIKRQLLTAAEAVIQTHTSELSGSYAFAMLCDAVALAQK